MNRKGYTLVEVVLGVILIGALASVLGVMMGKGVDSYLFVTGRTATVDQARFALARIQRDLSRAVYFTNNSDYWPYVSGSVLSIRVPPNGAALDVAAASADQTYCLNADRDLVVVTGPRCAASSSYLARKVNSLAFTYYDVAGQPTTISDNVRSVRVDLVLDDPTGGTVRLSTTVIPRIFLLDHANF